MSARYTSYCPTSGIRCLVRAGSFCNCCGLYVEQRRRYLGFAWDIEHRIYPLLYSELWLIFLLLKLLESFESHSVAHGCLGLACHMQPRICEYDIRRRLTILSGTLLEAARRQWGPSQTHCAKISAYVSPAERRGHKPHVPRHYPMRLRNHLSCLP